FADAVDRLVREHGFQIVFTGSAAEHELVNEIRSSLSGSSISLAGARLPELAAAVALAPLVITNNTGPAHIAAAVGTPVVDLYALTNPQHTPWMVPHRVLYHDVSCKFCYRSVCPEGHHHCLRLVEPQQVVDAVMD